MSDDPLCPGALLVENRAKLVSAQVTDIKYKFNVNTLEHLAGKVAELNDRRLQHQPRQPIAFDRMSAIRTGRLCAHEG